MTEASHRIFDTRRVALHRARVQAAPEEFLLREMTERLAERLEDISRRFPRMLDMSAKKGVLPSYLPASAGVERVEYFLPGEEEILPYEENTFDLVMSCGSLHWVNDVPGIFAQVRRILKPDGLFLALLPGGETLGELRQSFEAAEMHISGGISPRVSPFIDIRDAGALLQRAGFALPVADSERLTIEYDHPLKLLRDLRAMGQGNALLAAKKTFTGRALMMQMADHYVRHFPGEEGRVQASFDLLTLTAWKPHASQQQPARRGSGKVSLSMLGEKE